MPAAVMPPVTAGRSDVHRADGSCHGGGRRHSVLALPLLQPGPHAHLAGGANLRAVGGLTTREIADAFCVPEATMAQRISRAKRDLQGQRFDQAGDADRLRDVIGDRHRWHAVRGHLYEMDGDFPAAAAAYAEAARRATNVAERDHLVRQAARAGHPGVVERDEHWPSNAGCSFPTSATCRTKGP